MFRMAARNIKDNTSESVSEEQIKAVLRRSLDEVLIQVWFGMLIA